MVKVSGSHLYILNTSLFSLNEVCNLYSDCSVTHKYSIFLTSDFLNVCNYFNSQRFSILFSHLTFNLCEFLLLMNIIYYRYVSYILFIKSYTYKTCNRPTFL